MIFLVLVGAIKPPNTKSCTAIINDLPISSIYIVVDDNKIFLMHQDSYSFNGNKVNNKVGLQIFDS